jgi:hypothetical protein
MSEISEKKEYETEHAIYSPNSSYLVNMLDKIEHFVVGAKEMEENLNSISTTVGDVTKMSTEKLTEAINRVDPADTATREMLERYKKMRMEFEVMEIQILKEASRMLGFEQRDYLIKPLKDLIDKIKEGRLTEEEAAKDFKKLLRTVGINKAIIYTQMIPYIGEIVYALLNNLDNFAATRSLLERFVSLLKLIGVKEEKLKFISSYASESYFTRKYDGFRSWLADGAELGPLGPISICSFSPFSMFKHTQSGLDKDIAAFFYPQQELSEEYRHEPEPETEVEKSNGGGRCGGICKAHYVDNWISVRELKRKPNKKTRRNIHKINKSIRTHLSRLRRTRRKPFRKSVASFHVKRGF